MKTTGCNRCRGCRLVGNWQLPNTARARLEYHALSHLEQTAYADARNEGLNHKRALELVRELAEQHDEARRDLIDGYVQ